MKKILLIVTMAMCVCGTTLCAQEKKQKLTPEQRIDMWVIRMQNKLMLDDATAAKFAPVYKEYLQAKMECCKPCKTKCDNPTDEQIKKNIENRLDNRQKALDVEKKYFKKLSSILNGRQLQQVFCDKSKAKSWNKGKKAAFGKRGSKFNRCGKLAPCMNGVCPKNQKQCPQKGVCPQNDKCPYASAQ